MYTLITEDYTTFNLKKQKRIIKNAVDDKQKYEDHKIFFVQ